MDLLSLLILVGSLFVLAQSLFGLYLTIYSWEHPERLAASRGPVDFEKSRLSFTVLLPARHEELVIYDTIIRIWNTAYPRAIALARTRRAELLEIVVICHAEDAGTIAEANRAATAIGSGRVRVVVFDGGPINKPHALNVGLAVARNEVVAVFDAEDDVHPDVFDVVNTVMLREGVEIVQSGVQLMNASDHWFSLHNCLEYYFWFKSRLHFHARQGMIPLGGNTVFVHRRLLRQIGGWDEGCLTEDADIGVRLSALGHPIRVVYDPERVTREETPVDTVSWLRQRTRWQQGFLQVIRKGDWLRLTGVNRRLLALYTFGYPAVVGPLLAVWPLVVVVGWFVQVPLLVAMVSYLPLYALALQFLVTLIGARLFATEFGLHLPLRTYALGAITFVPYQLLLGVASVRAIYRELEVRDDWEKTEHQGAHRVAPLEAQS